MEHDFSADRPILSIDEDLLDRSRFAESLARAISGWKGLSRAARNGGITVSLKLVTEYLPQAMLSENMDKLVFISTAQQDACRVARHYCENREVIVLSERILPKQNASEDRPEVRYFIYVVLHEVVHAIKKHKSPKFDSLAENEYQAQEDEADALALKWFNEHVEARNNQYLKTITTEEINDMQKNNQALMENLYAGV